MKAIARKPLVRLVLPILVGVGMIVLGIVLLGSAPAQAGAPAAPQVEVAGTPTPPPPQNPPLRTPESSGPQIRFGNQNTGLNAVPFRTKVQIARGKPAPTMQSAIHAPKGQAPSGEPRLPKTPHEVTDFSPLVSSQGGVDLLYENFDSFYPPDFATPFSPTYGTSNWTVYDFSDTCPDPNYTYACRSWGPVEYALGYYGGWPAAFGPYAVADPFTDGYPDNLYSWLDYGPLDLSTMSDLYVDFWLWYDTEPEFDWVYFCVSTDGIDYNCDYWSGYSEGWLEQSYWLTSYAGYSTVYLAWLFASDGSISGYAGPYIDDIYVWADDTPPAPPPTPDPDGQLVQNESFEDTPNLNHWTPDVTSGGEVSATSNTYLEGAHSAYIAPPAGGSGFLYQTLNVPADASSVVIDYWFALSTLEINPDADYFCASLRSTVNWDIFWADLGCIDAVDAPYGWQESIFTLSPDEVTLVAGQPVDFVFEMYDTGSSGEETWVYMDYIRVYAPGGSAAAAVDPNEPNNDLANATPGLTCAGVVSGTIGDALGGYDIDWFELNVTQGGSLQLDIDAQTKVQDPHSTLDSVLRLYSNGGAELAYNDDDDVTTDSFISYTVSAGNYYVSVESYTGYGDANAFYDLTARCNSTAAAPVGGNEAPPEADTWTLMLYLNAEDPNFESILTQYRQDIEAFVGSKQPWLKVVILYDGPNTGDTVRYLVQSGGAYTTGTNRWNLGELNMGDPDTLANFVTWAMDNYPAENYYLALDDHGDGAYGISRDLNPTPLNQPQLIPPEVYSALKEATRNGARKISIVDYEACLMGLTENAYDMREWADYVVFSQQISWGINTYPMYFSDLISTTTPLVAGQRIVDRYSSGARAEGRPHTISLIDTFQLTALRTAINNFANALSQNGAGNETRRTSVTSARNTSQAFAADREATNAFYADYIDLWDLADKSKGLASAQATAVQNAVQAAVKAERHASGGFRSGPSTYLWNHAGAHGLSIYFPADGTSPAFSGYTAQTLYQMTQVDSAGQNGMWDEFLTWVYPTAGGAGGHGRGMSMSRAEIKLAGGTSFVYGNLYLPLIRR